MPFILLNKPFDVLCQFSGAEESLTTLASFICQPDVYSVGRLDKTSEGLLLLTDDGALSHKIVHPSAKVPKTYWVQVEGKATQADLEPLILGVASRDQTLRAKSARCIPEPALWARVPPIRTRQTVPDSWVEIVLTEGKNRQVRRMTAAVGLPTLRLIRVSIGPWQLAEIAPGEYLSISNTEARQALANFRAGA